MPRVMKSFPKRLLFATALFGCLGLMNPSASADTFRVGIVTFLSGQAAESFGVPAWRGGEVLIEKMNAGEVPAPYNKKGFGGLTIEPIVIDEAGGANKQVQEFRNLVQRDRVDAVVGYVSSGDCLAVAPVAEELQAFTILYDCGTPRIFEDAKYTYVFRTAAHATQDNVGLVRYLQRHGKSISSYAGINQDYAWGHDSWRDFKGAMTQIFPNARGLAEYFPAFGSGQYGTEISALLRNNADIVYSSLWGGDLQAFVLQGAPRGIFRRSQVVFSAADHVLPPLGTNIPEGVIVGSRGAYGYMAPDTELNRWWFKAYQDKWNVIPVQAPYRMAQALLGLKLAVERAMEANGGVKPNAKQLADAMRGSSWESPGGLIEMALGNGHQAIQPIAFGRTKHDGNRTILTDIVRFDARCVNPPADMTSTAWIESGFRGHTCDR